MLCYNETEQSNLQRLLTDCLLPSGAGVRLKNHKPPFAVVFLRPKEMSEQQESYSGMLEFWEDLITLAKCREDWAALRNIPVDIYLMLGYDVKTMLGEPSEDEESGNILSDGCHRSEAHIYYD